MTTTTEKRLFQRIKPIAWLIFCLSVVLASFWAGRLWVNVTDSMPLGLWRMSSAPMQLDKVRRGQVVAFCPPPDFEIFRRAKEKGILQEGSCAGSYMPLLKEVAGLPGDVIEYTNLFSVNGQQLPNSQVLAIDLDGAQLPLFSRLIVPAGKVWLMSSHSGLSFDSRYFGLVDQDQILGLADPLLISP